MHSYAQNDLHDVVGLHEVLAAAHVTSVVLDLDDEPPLQRFVPEVVRVHSEIVRICPVIQIDALQLLLWTPAAGADFSDVGLMPNVPEEMNVEKVERTKRSVASSKAQELLKP